MRLFFMPGRALSRAVLLLIYMSARTGGKIYSDLTDAVINRRAISDDIADLFADNASTFITR
jgi:hypothetical protein